MLQAKKQKARYSLNPSGLYQVGSKPPLMDRQNAGMRCLQQQEKSFSTKGQAKEKRPKNVDILRRYLVVALL